MLQRLTAATNKDAANRQHATLNSDVNDVDGYQGDQDRTNHTDIVNVTSGGISTQNPQVKEMIQQNLDDRPVD